MNNTQQKSSTTDNSRQGGHFWLMLPGAFLYPLRSRCKLLLAAGLVFFAGVSVLGQLTHPFFSSLITLFFSGYLIAYIFRIVRISASGSRDAPPWPDVRNREELIIPVALTVGVFAVCLIPAIFWSIVSLESAGKDVPVSDHARSIAWLFVAIGMIQMPLALLSVALRESISALNPIPVWWTIIKILPAYLAICTVFAAMIVVTWAGVVFLEPNLPYAGSAITFTAGLYLMITLARLAGLAYFCYPKQITWKPRTTEHE